MKILKKVFDTFANFLKTMFYVFYEEPKYKYDILDDYYELESKSSENRTEQNRTEQNRTEQNRTEQNRTEQNRTEQN